MGKNTYKRRTSHVLTSMNLVRHMSNSTFDPGLRKEVVATPSPPPPPQPSLLLHCGIFLRGVYAFGEDCHVCKNIFYTKKYFPSSLTLWHLMDICEHVDPNHAQKYTNCPCCWHGNMLVYTFVRFSMHYF